MKWYGMATATSMSLLLLGLALPGGDATAQQDSLKKQLVGAWTMVSVVETLKDGKKVDAWGPNSKGAIIYDASGRYMFMITRGDLPKFASNKRSQATADEGRAIAQGMIAYFGTFSVNELDKSILHRVESSSFPNTNGVEQKRIITSITSDELRYANPTTTTGSSVEAVWKRSK